MNEHRGLSDEALVRSVADGDALALGELYDRHADALFRVAFRRLGDRQLAEEVLQDTYLALWRRAELFDAAAGSPLVWLASIARHRAIDRLRGLRRRPLPMPLSVALPSDAGDRALEGALADGSFAGQRDPASLDPAGVVDRLVFNAQVRQLLEVLPDEERRVIDLAYYGELTQAEIAERLGWPLGTVKTRTRRALGRLREAWGHRYDDNTERIP